MRYLLGNVDLHKVVFQGVELYHIRRGRSGTLPEISKSPSENRPGLKRKIVFQASIFFRCELLVSGKVPTSIKCLNTFAREDLNSTRMSWRMIFLVVDFYPKFFYLFATEIVDIKLSQERLDIHMLGCYPLTGCKWRIIGILEHLMIPLLGSIQTHIKRIWFMMTCHSSYSRRCIWACGFKFLDVLIATDLLGFYISHRNPNLIKTLPSPPHPTPTPPQLHPTPTPPQLHIYINPLGAGVPGEPPAPRVYIYKYKYFWICLKCFLFLPRQIPKKWPPGFHVE